jgi:glucose dehydrogenase
MRDANDAWNPVGAGIGRGAAGNADRQRHGDGGKRWRRSVVDAARIQAASAVDWLSYGRTYDEQRFSPLDRDQPGNVGALGLAWSADIDTARGQEATPLVIDGVIYITTAWSKAKAYDAARAS